MNDQSKNSNNSDLSKDKLRKKVADESNPDWDFNYVEKSDQYGDPNKEDSLINERLHEFFNDPEKDQGNLLDVTTKENYYLANKDENLTKRSDALVDTPIAGDSLSDIQGNRPGIPGGYFQRRRTVPVKGDDGSELTEKVPHQNFESPQGPGNVNMRRLPWPYDDDGLSGPMACSDAFVKMAKIVHGTDNLLTAKEESAALFSNKEIKAKLLSFSTLEDLQTYISQLAILRSLSKNNNFQKTGEEKVEPTALGNYGLGIYNAFAPIYPVITHPNVFNYATVEDIRDLIQNRIEGSRILDDSQKGYLSRLINSFDISTREGGVRLIDYITNALMYAQKMPKDIHPFKSKEPYEMSDEELKQRRELLHPSPPNPPAEYTAEEGEPPVTAGNSEMCIKVYGRIHNSMDVIMGINELGLGAYSYISGYNASDGYYITTAIPEYPLNSLTASAIIDRINNEESTYFYGARLAILSAADYPAFNRLIDEAVTQAAMPEDLYRTLVAIKYSILSRGGAMSPAYQNLVPLVDQALENINNPEQIGNILQSLQSAAQEAATTVEQAGIAAQPPFEGGIPEGPAAGVQKADVNPWLPPEKTEISRTPAQVSGLTQAYPSTKAQAEAQKQQISELLAEGYLPKTEIEPLLTDFPWISQLIKPEMLKDLPTQKPKSAEPESARKPQELSNEHRQNLMNFLKKRKSSQDTLQKQAVDPDYYSEWHIPSTQKSQSPAVSEEGLSLEEPMSIVSPMSELDFKDNISEKKPAINTDPYSSVLREVTLPDTGNVSDGGLQLEEPITVVDPMAELAYPRGGIPVYPMSELDLDAVTEEPLSIDTDPYNSTQHEVTLPDTDAEHEAKQIELAVSAIPGVKKLRDQWAGARYGKPYDMLVADERATVDYLIHRRYARPGMNIAEGPGSMVTGLGEMFQGFMQPSKEGSIINLDLSAESMTTQQNIDEAHKQSNLDKDIPLEIVDSNELVSEPLPEEVTVRQISIQRVGQAVDDTVNDSEENTEESAQVYEQRAGEVFVGDAWRAESNLLVRGNSAKEIVDFEAEELGNMDIAQQAYSLGIDLAAIPERETIWVTKTQKEAQRYGDADKVDIAPGSVILANDGEGGYLVWNRQGGSSPETSLDMPVSEEDASLYSFYTQFIKQAASENNAEILADTLRRRLDFIINAHKNDDPAAVSQLLTEELEARCLAFLFQDQGSTISLEDFKQVIQRIGADILIETDYTIDVDDVIVSVSSWYADKSEEKRQPAKNLPQMSADESKLLNEYTADQIWEIAQNEMDPHVQIARSLIERGIVASRLNLEKTANLTKIAGYMLTPKGENAYTRDRIGIYEEIDDPTTFDILGKKPYPVGGSDIMYRILSELDNVHVVSSFDELVGNLEEMYKEKIGDVELQALRDEWERGLREGLIRTVEELPMTGETFDLPSNMPEGIASRESLDLEKRGDS